MGVDDSASQAASGRLLLPDRPLGVSCGLGYYGLGHSLSIDQLEASKHHSSMLLAGQLVLSGSWQECLPWREWQLAPVSTHYSAALLSFLQAHLAFARCWPGKTSPHGVEVSCRSHFHVHQDDIDMLNAGSTTASHGHRRMMLAFAPAPAPVPAGAPLPESALVSNGAPAGQGAPDVAATAYAV